MDSVGTGRALLRGVTRKVELKLLSPSEVKMLVLISLLMLTALFIQVLCFVCLSKADAPAPRPDHSRDTEEIEEKKTKVVRPIRIVRING